MSGQFNPDEPGINATDDPEVAKRHGLVFDEAAARYIRPPQTSDAGGRDGDEAYQQKRQAYIDEGEEQQRAADEARKAAAADAETGKDAADKDNRDSGNKPDVSDKDDKDKATPTKQTAAAAKKAAADEKADADK